MIRLLLGRHQGKGGCDNTSDTAHCRGTVLGYIPETTDHYLRVYIYSNSQKDVRDEMERSHRFVRLFTLTYTGG